MTYDCPDFCPSYVPPPATAMPGIGAMPRPATARPVTQLGEAAVANASDGQSGVGITLDSVKAL
jgi:hypothetical protein